MKKLEKLFAQAVKDASENYAAGESVGIETDNRMYSQRNVDRNGKNGYNEKNNTNGGIENAEKVDTGRNSSTENSQSGTRETDEDRSRVQSARGKKTPRVPETREASDGMHNRRGREVKHPNDYTDSDFVHPENGTALHTLQSKALEDYGLKCHIIKESSWGRDAEAYIFKGEIYAVETISEDSLKDVIPHEGTHAMNAMEFKPYLDFIERTPDMVDFHSKATEKLVKDVEEHLRKNDLDFDFFDMNPKQHKRFYDELNAYVYGLTKGGALEDSNYTYSKWLPSAFRDFDAYINELTSIHEQFKAERKGNDTLYSRRSDRSLLAEALDSLAENEIDKKKLAEYKRKLTAVNKQDKILAGLTERKTQLEADKKAGKDVKIELAKVNGNVTKLFRYMTKRY